MPEMNLLEQIAETRKAFEAAVEGVSSEEDVARLRADFTGRNGRVRRLFSGLGSVPAGDRKEMGQALNALKKDLEKRVGTLQVPDTAERTAGPLQDPTLPGIAPEPGRRHPIQRTYEEIARVFLKLGFNVKTGPEIEEEGNNFEALNIPIDHPARDDFDTFYIKGKWLLRSHTSPVQIRTMREPGIKPPIRIIAPGKVYRPDTPDAGHSPMFHQVEGLMVDRNVTFAQLKGVLELFARAMWGNETKIRFRPSFFPFTEPSAEVDVSCFICGAEGCPACKQSGWVEILGAGMVNPKVLSNCGIDPEEYTGFAFGMGVERICMLKYRIPDIRLLFENHFSFLGQIW